MKKQLIVSDIVTLPDGKIVHSTSDSYGPILVIDFPRYRALDFNSIYEQSSFDLKNPYGLVHAYTRIMLLVLGFIEPRHITLLGLGGGSLLRSLHHLLAGCDFQVVELRSRVYEVAREYFDIPDDERVWISIEDAELHIRASADASTDIIFADMFDAYSMSPLQVQQQFLLECWRMLSDKGWLVINYHRLPDMHSPFFQYLRDYFETILVCSADYGNHILFVSKVAVVDYAQASRTLKKMEKILNECFMPLFYRLKPIAVGVITTGGIVDD